MSYTLLLPLLSCYLILINLTTSAPPACDQSCNECLDQSDFTSGTFRIRTPNKKYCLSEDIEFNPLPPPSGPHPNAPFASCFPLNDDTFPGCRALSNGPFALGFFAAISIEADNIELDLTNHEIKMSEIFYIQQRYFSIIEIGSSPFITGQGPANFGPNDGIIQGTYIHDGVLGLSSHSGLHSNHAQDTRIENIRVADFETAGIQFNSFANLNMNNLIIGPSSTQVKPCGYYANGKFLSLALDKLIEQSAGDPNPTVTFSGGRVKTIEEIYNDLITSLDIAYRYFIDESTDDDKNNELYDISIDLYSNPMGIPDGASISGIILKSQVINHDVRGDLSGENAQITNIKISDLKLNVNEIPAAYFDQCVDPYAITKEIIKGPFGDVMDLRRMVGEYTNGQIIDLGDDFTRLSYVGNPLSDAQIALGLLGDEYGLEFGIQGQNKVFLKWALDSYNGQSYSTLPPCTSFTCNGDIMFHANKGIMGLRTYNVEDVTVENIIIKKLMNKSPLSSYACQNYSGPHDGGILVGHKEEENNERGTDVRGIVITGGDVTFDGYNNVIQKLVSYNGDVIGLDIKNDAQVDFDYVFKDELPQKVDDFDTEDDKSSIQIRQLAPGHEITFALLAELLVDEQYPYPNNFYACNIKIENKLLSSIDPYPPNGIDKVWCADYVPDDTDAVIRKILPVDLKIDAEANDDNQETETPPRNAEAPANAIKINKANLNDKMITKNKDKNKDKNIIDKYPNTPYIYFMIGLICIIMVVFVLVTFIMKGGKMIMNQDIKYNKAYAKASLDDSDSDLTEDEENQQF